MSERNEQCNKAMSDAADAVLGYTTSARQVGKVNNAVTKAQRALDEAVRGYGANSKQGRKAQDQLGESQREPGDKWLRLRRSTVCVD
jgi:outer membrane protein TolC